MINRVQKLLLLFLVLGAVLPSLSYAQFGEVAGHLIYNVSIGTQVSHNLTIVNGQNTPASFRVVLPSMSGPANSTTPIITISPMNGTIPPKTQYPLNVTAYIPSTNNKPGYEWVGVIQVLLVGNSTAATSGGSASIITGVAKTIEVVALQPIFPTTLVIVAIIAIVVIAAGLVYYFKVMKNKKPARAAVPSRVTASRSAASRSASSRKVTAKKSATKKKSSKAKKSTKKKTATKRRRSR